MKVAVFDASADPRSARRLSISTLPTIILFKEGKLYRYHGKINVNNLRQFAEKDYDNGEYESGLVPSPASIFTEIVDIFYEIFGDLYVMTIMKPLTLVVIFSIGFLISTVLVNILAAIKAKPTPVQAPPKPKEE
eukprot:NODE_4712_length_1126_cov_31.407777_g4179_i0.p1 GENE.NODE_4712_length_1126_cov_31.407777_g4179_i0~~NODE_4712_length_1126_cov_31.407777_g4179_i0.p1  ORF type:complete len:134 (+),score=17.84 NODE_4712_length_1126_cov_31.407777_g4179_i0:555-956(+)